MVAYIHGGGRIGVLVEADTNVVNDEIRTCLKNVAMQVAAMSPKYVSRDEVSQEFMDHEKEILLAQAKKENPNKPDNIIEKMIVGRLNKELKEYCLLDQVYVQDSDLTVGKYVEKVAKEETNAEVTVKKFVRFETGEGIEKKVDDFAAEVAAQAGNASLRIRKTRCCRKAGRLKTGAGVTHSYESHLPPEYPQEMYS